MTNNLAPLAQAWIDAKRAETAANAARIKIEAEMIAALEIPDEGSKTQKIEGYKITVTQPVARKLDVDMWEKVKGLIPAEMAPVKIKIEADAVGCKYLAANEPKLWRKIAKAFETKPGKVIFRIEGI